MSCKLHRRPRALLWSALTGSITAPALAQSGGPFNIPWSRIGGGGAAAAGGVFTVRGSIGQPAAAAISGGRFRVRSGFWGPPPCRSPRLMVCRPDSDAVMLVDGCDGSVVNPVFIRGGSQGMRQPIEALQVGQEIWVSDQLADRVFRYTLAGEFISSVSGGMDDVRGMERVGASVLVTNNGTGNGAPGPRVLRFTNTGSPAGSFEAGTNPWDILDYDGGLLITDINLEDILRYSYNGVQTRVFHNSCQTCPGIDFPGQMSRRTNGNVLVAGYSAPAGIYEYDRLGTEVNFIPYSAPVRGVHELGNGDLMFSTDEGVYVYGVTSRTSTLVAAGSARFITPFDGSAVALCYADCDLSTGPGVLDIFDFLCFQNRFDAGDPYACDCDTSTGPGVCDIFDFLCFQNAFAAGCP